MIVSLESWAETLRVPLAGALLCSLLISGQAMGADTDEDGLVDNSDNCTLVSNSDQRDNDNDGYGNLCDGDFNNDAETNFGDWFILRQLLGQPGDRRTDLNGDGITNFADVIIFRDLVGMPPGPTGTHPFISNCSCYFSGDCNGGSFCNYGPGGPSEEDVCFWRLPKPEGVPGEGCDAEYEGPWGPVCDGFCSPAAIGSSLGSENPALVGQAVALWADALLIPALAGGGPLEESFAEAAEALPFQSPDSAGILGRHVADLLSIAASTEFYDYFCHYEWHPDEPTDPVDLSQDSCRAAAGRLATEALLAELALAGDGAPFVRQIAEECPAWQLMFTPRCEAGPDALDCFERLIADLAVFLSTPPRQ